MYVLLLMVMGCVVRASRTAARGWRMCLVGGPPTGVVWARRRGIELISVLYARGGGAGFWEAGGWRESAVLLLLLL